MSFLRRQYTPLLGLRETSSDSAVTPIDAFRLAGSYRPYRGPRLNSTEAWDLLKSRCEARCIGNNRPLNVVLMTRGDGNHQGFLDAVKEILAKFDGRKSPLNQVLIQVLHVKGRFDGDKRLDEVKTKFQREVDSGMRDMVDVIKLPRVTGQAILEAAQEARAQRGLKI